MQHKQIVLLISFHWWALRCGQMGACKSSSLVHERGLFVGHVFSSPSHYPPFHHAATGGHLPLLIVAQFSSHSTFVAGLGYTYFCKVSPFCAHHCLFTIVFSSLCYICHFMFHIVVQFHIYTWGPDHSDNNTCQSGH